MKRANGCILGDNSRQDCRFCKHYLQCTACIFPSCDSCEFKENCYYLKQLPKTLKIEDLCIDPYRLECNGCGVHGTCPAIKELVRQIEPIIITREVR